MIIADDITGALDTAIQFTKYNIPTVTFLSYKNFKEFDDQNEQAYVINAETRHMSADKAYQRVCFILDCAFEYNIKYLYIKTDSALRGNIGKELEAALNYTGLNRLFFAPAYPINERTTQNGIQYYKGLPIAETEFGKDPFEQVESSNITEIIAKQSNVNTTLCPIGGKINYNCKEKNILIFDAVTDHDLDNVCQIALRETPPVLLAGCAGLADHFAKMISNSDLMVNVLPRLHKLLIVSGSLNPISQGQLEYIEHNKIPSIVLTKSDFLFSDFNLRERYQEIIKEGIECLDKTGLFIIRTSSDEGAVSRENDVIKNDTRLKVSEAIAKITCGILNGVDCCGLFVIGGDTFLAIADQIGCGIIYPVMEVEAGIPMSVSFNAKGDKQIILTKSGGFGCVDVLNKIINSIMVFDSGGYG